jgi:hypothetical protein
MCMCCTQLVFCCKDGTKQRACAVGILAGWYVVPSPGTSDVEDLCAAFGAQRIDCVTVSASDQQRPSKTHVIHP